VILLINTTSKLQITTASTGTADIYACYVDAGSSSLTPSGTGTGMIQPTTATTTDLVAAPAASTTRNVKTLNIRNTHATNANTYTVVLADSAGLTVTLMSVALAAGEMLTYVEGMGWNIIATDGAYKAVTPRMLYKALAADDAGGSGKANLQPWFPTAGGVLVASNTMYAFEGMLQLTTGATTHTTAQAFSAGTAVVSSIMYQYWLTSAASGAIATTASEAVVTSTAAFVMNATSALLRRGSSCSARSG
jgi:hypothetical protein